MNSIPASKLVNVIPSVLGAGGNPLSLNAVFLTEDGSIPIGSVQGFPNAAAVDDWFGPESTESDLANVYFNGYDGSNTLPGMLYFVQYNSAAVAAYLRSGDVSGLSLAELQAFSGTVIIMIDGRTVTSPNIDLSSATSFSNAAALIQTGLQTLGSIFAGTGSQAAGVVTVATTTSGRLHIGDALTGAGVEPNTHVLSFGSYDPGTGVGTVNVDTSGTVSSGAIDVTSAATVTYDSLRGGFVITSPTTGVNSSIAAATGTLAADILINAGNATLSQGAAAATPAGTMDMVVSVTQNWVTFMTVFDPDEGSEPATIKLEFADWVSNSSPAGKERFCYAAWDSDPAPANSNSAPSSFGARVAALGYNGVEVIYDLSAGQKAAFFCGTTASLDPTETQGRITYAFKGQAGLQPDVTSATVADNLIANGYNFYGAYATANDQFSFYQPGSISGSWDWADEYIDQIILNASFQLALVTLLKNTKSIPYNQRGYALLRETMSDPINAGLNFGSIQAGVPLSAQQAQEVNTAAGTKIDTTLSQLGWYLQILPAVAQTRGTRGSPPMTFWYTDGGSIQQITLASIDVQ